MKFPTIRMEEWLSVLLPLPCPLCESAEKNGNNNSFCSECLSKMPLIHIPYCPDCGGPLDSALARCHSCLREPHRPWKEAVSLFQHREPVRNLIHQLKYRHRPDLARAFGLLAAPALNRFSELPEIIISVPLHPFRQWMRGYNQAALLGERIGAYSGIPFKEVMFRRGGIWSHQMKRGRRERLQQKNMGLFGVRDSEVIQGKRVLAVDDVFTTGATLSAVTTALLNAGAESVFILTVSRD